MASGGQGSRRPGTKPAGNMTEVASGSDQESLVEGLFEGMGEASSLSITAGAGPLPTESSARRARRRSLAHFCGPSCPRSGGTELERRCRPIDRGTNLISKPFSFEGLASKVRQVLITAG
jgi:hypothetical protein